MKNLETINQFIELRSLGNSFESIAKTLNLNKSTLIKWNKKFEKEIIELKKIQFDEIKEKFLTAKKYRIELMSEVFSEIKSKVKEQPGLMDYERLIMLLMKISHYFDRSEFADFKISYFLNQNSKNDSENDDTDKLL
jgi:hypothetical protein